MKMLFDRVWKKCSLQTCSAAVSKDLQEQFGIALWEHMKVEDTAGLSLWIES